MAEPGLKGKGLGGVRFVNSDELGRRAPLRNEQILGHWSEDLLLLDQPVHISECPLPNAFARFGQEGSNWPIADPRVGSNELRTVHGWPPAAGRHEGKDVAGANPGGPEGASNAHEASPIASPGQAEGSDGEQGWGTGDEGEQSPQRGPSGGTPGRG